MPISKRIRAIYYLANLRVPESIQGSEPLNVLLRDHITSTGMYLFDNKSNGIIISERGDIIAGVMEIILRLDSSESKETVITVPLYNSVARTVADLIKNQIIAAGAPDQRGQIIRSDVKTESGLYFASSTRVVADDRTNSLILMGKETAVERLKEFIQEYIDASPDSGRSILHVYDLQYLDAESFAPVLKEIVTARGIGTGQAQREVTGPQQFFEGVLVVPESYKPAAAGKTLSGTASTAGNDGSEGSVYRGGNRLIITALHKDWIRIKPIIQELDVPQKQVILEIMIVDLTIRDAKKLATQLRNPSGLQLPPGFNFQSAQIIGPITDQTIVDPPNPTTLAADLLRLLLGTNPPVSVATQLTSAANDNNGAMVLAVNDPNGSGVWSLFTLLSRYSETKVLSHPYLVTLNNVRAQEIVSEIRRARGDQSVGEGAISTIRNEDIKAELSVSVTPRISSSERVNLQISIEITDFTSPQVSENFTRVTRKLQTNANLSTGQILVLGGLTRLEETDANTDVPLLSQIPILGWFLKSKDDREIKTNLAIFITPTIVTPKLTAGQDKYTNDKLQRGYDVITEGMLFDNMRDPITRWFFQPRESDDLEMLDEYVEETRFLKTAEALAPIKQDKTTVVKTAQNQEHQKTEELKMLLADQDNPFDKPRDSA